ncbi:MAG: trimethylamine methyltransferase family protein [Anaerolineae bacterium]
MKKGLMGGSLKVLSESDLQRVHEASLTLLQDQGLYSESDLIIDIFAKAGGQVDREGRIIRVSRDMVDAALKTAPSSFTLYGRDPQHDILLEPGRVYWGMGGTPEPYVYDYELGHRRLPTKDDMVACTRVGQSLRNVEFVMALCAAGDMPQNVQIFHEYDAMFRNTLKPVITTAPGRNYARHYIEMAAAASGGEEALRKRPCIVMFTQPVSPMKISHYSETMVEAAEYGIPILSSPGPMMGATSPASLAGTLAQVSAEALFGVVLSQLIKEGTPVIYAPHTGVMDMVTAQCTYGSAEQSLARAAVAQLGIFYGLPTFGLGGGVEAKLPDAEAAGEAMMGMMLNALSGLTLTQTLGTLASGLYGAPEMAVICDELVLMISRILKGITVNDETLAIDVIQEVGHGGHFLGHEHTSSLFREELFFPSLFRRQSIDQWQDRGSKNMTQAAHERVESILAKAGPVELPEGADVALEQALQKAIKNA